MKKFLVVLSIVSLFLGSVVSAGELAPTVPEAPLVEQPKNFGNYLPAEIPNIFDPEVRAQYQPVDVANLRGNPDFPVLILQNIVGGQPQTMLVGLDARNGKEGWSLASDPIILIILFANPETILGTYVDAGFADSGKPSRVFRKLDDLKELKGLGKGVSLTFM
ncbi:hypothetical protein A2127_00355 [Candidatus Jorgensenbacteria bacterium GWC1_48_12]|uniref:Nitroreductase domain-containing protein n=2 Tax=Parcubacteria group TaxID=1794811 RepID=A0A1F6BRQ5_9BACT|nr:MAG: hypothetical protein A2567_01535 [Candidatus Azambacteria bacterium RIFOXYD1_FULL_42_11]OGG39606.1 MAG: hypothetical protein A2127_00355 [Candidatus Jorgensenbacteria bacterium GWC1_48_12]